jgi:hypothetical protein
VKNALSAMQVSVRNTCVSPVGAKIRPVRLLFQIAFLGLLAALSPAGAETGQKAFGLITVVANVQPTAVLKFQFTTVQLNVTAEDIARGYIELPVSSLLSVNAGKLVPNVVVDFTPTEGAFRSLEIRTRDSFTAASGQTSGTASEAVLSYRINLAERARPGNYPMPLTVNVLL